MRERRTALSRQEVDIARLREQLLGAAVQEVVSGIRVRHGEAKLPRKPTLHAAIRAGQRDRRRRANLAAGRMVVLVGGGLGRGTTGAGWKIRSFTSICPSETRTNSEPTSWRRKPARRVLDERGVPDSMEGQEACESMKTRLSAAEAARDGIVREIVRAARVLQGGGGELHGEDLRSRLDAGIEASLARLYPRFPDADHRSWRVALNRVRDGGDQPFKIVGWHEAVARHPVALEVLDAVGTGNRGGAVRKKLAAAPYGWPQDAIDAALVALHGGDHLKAAHNGRPVQTAQLDQKTIGGAEFRPEKVRITVTQRTKIRGLYRLAGISAKSGEEAARAAEFLAALRKLASEAGGEPPLPIAPRPSWLDDLGPPHWQRAAPRDLQRQGRDRESDPGLDGSRGARPRAAAAVGVGHRPAPPRRRRTRHCPAGRGAARRDPVAAPAPR